MEKIELKRRTENALRAFLETPKKGSAEIVLSADGDSAMRGRDVDWRSSEQADRFVKILKRGFIFLPGALYLFFGTFSILSFEFLRTLPTMMTILLIGSFMTIFGFGNMKNPKHAVIPLSIISVAILTFSFFSLLQIAKYVFEFGVYFLPVALIAPVLAKNIADRKAAGEDRRLTVRGHLL